MDLNWSDFTWSDQTLFCKYYCWRARTSTEEVNLSAGARLFQQKHNWTSTRASCTVIILTFPSLSFSLIMLLFLFIFYEISQFMSLKCIENRLHKTRAENINTNELRAELKAFICPIVFSSWDFWEIITIIRQQKAKILWRSTFVFLLRKLLLTCSHFNCNHIHIKHMFWVFSSSMLASPVKRRCSVSVTLPTSRPQKICAPWHQ